MGMGKVFYAAILKFANFETSKRDSIYFPIFKLFCVVL